jgi:hypothetical protein
MQKKKNNVSKNNVTNFCLKSTSTITIYFKEKDFSTSLAFARQGMEGCQETVLLI